MLRARNNSSGPGVSFTYPGPKGKTGRREQLPEQGETAQWGQDHPAGAVTFHPRTILMTRGIRDWCGPAGWRGQGEEIWKAKQKVSSTNASKATGNRADMKAPDWGRGWTAFSLRSLPKRTCICTGGESQTCVLYHPFIALALFHSSGTPPAPVDLFSELSTQLQYICSTPNW